MKSRLNYKSRKTIIITAIIIALLALSATGIYMFTKGNDEARAFTEGNTMVEGSESPVVIPEEGTTPEEPTVEPNVGSKNNGEQAGEQGTTTNQSGTTTSTTAPNVPNQEYVTERQEEVERLTEENFLVSWNPISLATVATDIELDELNEEANYEVSKVATLVNGEAIRNENGEFRTRVKEGDEVTYIITVKNTGKVTIKNIEVVDELANYKETIPVLAIGDSKELKVTYTVKQEDMTKDDTILNVAKAGDNEGKEEIPSNPSNVKVTATKVWVDTEAQRVHRPANIVVKLMNGTTEVATKTISNTTETVTFENLIKYDENGNEINYTVEEAEENKDDLKFYESKVEGTTITNTFKLPDDIKNAKTQLAITKVWSDTEAQKVHRPENIKLQLKANGTNSGEEVTVTGTENTWNYTFENLAKYDENGNEITYTAVETSTNKFYEMTQDGNTITNTFKLPDDVKNEKTNVPVTKVWVDTEAQRVHRPTNIVIKLMNGTTEVGTYTMNAKTETSYTFENLPRYDENGNEIKYTVVEVEKNENDLKYYESSVNQETKTITNTFKLPEDVKNAKTQVVVSKVWNDGNNQDDSRKDITVKVQLYANTKAQGTAVILTENNHQIGNDINLWQYRFTDLQKYDENGNLINYTAKEIGETNGLYGDYQVTYEGPIYNVENNEYVARIENSYTPAKVNETGKIKVTKNWANDIEANRPTEGITVQLKSKTKIEATKTNVGEPVTMTPNVQGKWEYEFTDLPANRNGKTITYSVEEVNVPSGYVATYGGTVKDGLTITNTLQKANISVEKTATARVNANSDITYTIKLTNSGDITGNVKVIDTLPEGVTLKVDKLTDGGSYDETTRTITWSDVSVATTGKTLQFTATANGNEIGETVTNNVQISSNNAITEISKNADNATTVINEKNVIVEEMIEGKKQTTGSNIVLVLDLSSSMNFSTNNDNQETAPLDERRLTAAKNAITTFINDFYANGQNKTSTISVVTFNNSASVIKVGNNNYATSNNYGTLVTAVRNISIGEASSGYGTYMIPAFDTTYNAIYGRNGLESKYKDNQNVVMFLTDGEPSDETGGILGFGAHTDYDGVKSAAKAITDKGAKLYSIGFGPTYETTPNPINEKTPYWLLQTISTDKTVHKATDADELVKQFKDIEASSNTKTTLTTGTFKGQEIDNGVLKIQLSKELKIDGNNHLTIKHGDTVIIDCTSKEQLLANSITYNESEKTLIWDLNEFISNSQTINALDDSLELVYYIPLN